MNASPESPKQALVVDDSPTQLRVIRVALEKAGFAVHEARNGAEALLQVGERPYHLILSDCQMPLMDGYQFCRLVKDAPETRSLPVILLTGAQTRLARFWARTCGADLVLTKGQNRDDVVAAALRLAREEPLPDLSTKTRSPRHDHGLDAIQRRLASALENRLLKTTLVNAVAELRSRVEDPTALGWAFLTLLEDLVLPGALYLVYPTPFGPRAQFLASTGLDPAVLEEIRSDLLGDPLASGAPMRLESRFRPVEEKPPRQLTHVDFPLPVAGGGFQGRWGIWVDPRDHAAHQELLQDANQEFHQVFGAMVTLSYLGDANRRLLKADQARADFVSTVVHELRNPLGATSSALSLLRGAWEQGQTQNSRELLDICQRNVDRLLRISNAVLDLEKLESGQFVVRPVSLDPVALCAGVLDEMRSLGLQRRISLELEAPDPPPGRILVDPDRAAQCLVNLLSNALAHSPDGGRVVLGLSPKNEGLEMEVRNSGKGIPEDFQGRIFQRFQQAEGGTRGGTGLGLAITKGFMQAMGGSVRFETHPEGPTSFFLLFPKPS